MPYAIMRGTNEEKKVNRFWIILAVVVIGLGAIFIATKPKENSASTFTGDAKVVQADDHIRNGKDKKVTLIEYGDFQLLGNL